MTRIIIIDGQHLKDDTQFYDSIREMYAMD